MAIPTKTRRSINKTTEDYKFGFKTDTKSIFKSKKGLNEEIIKEISKHKNEPKWMLDFRLNAYEIFKKD